MPIDAPRRMKTPRQPIRLSPSQRLIGGYDQQDGMVADCPRRKPFAIPASRQFHDFDRPELNRRAWRNISKR
jgi:hypothetical protein